MYYSVPYEYVQSQVDIRVSKDLIEVYFKDMRIASYKILLGEIGRYSTYPNHMPDNHRKYLEHTPGQIKRWASSKGDSVINFVDYILINHAEKKALDILLSFKNLERYCSDDLIEKACQTLITILHVPSLAVLKTILKRMKEKNQEWLAPLMRPLQIETMDL